MQALAGGNRVTTRSGVLPLPLLTCTRSTPAAPQLTQALAGGSRITTLNLSSNNIGDAGAKALAEMLKVRTKGGGCSELH